MNLVAIEFEEAALPAVCGRENAENNRVCLRGERSGTPEDGGGEQRRELLP